MAQNMYRVGDYVYFEVSSAAPYQIRKIEELNKNASGQVEAKVMCFYRRRDISPALLKIADQAERKFADYFEEDKVPEGYKNTHTVATMNGVMKKEEENGGTNGFSDKKEEEELIKGSEWGSAGLPMGSDILPDNERHRMRLRELYVSRHMETLPATHIRGKCCVTLLSEVEAVESYDRDDAFFYSLMYDPTQYTLLADKGAIRVGEKYQAVVPDDIEAPSKEKNVKEEEDEYSNENGDLMIAEEEGIKEEIDGERASSSSTNNKDEREVLVYHPHHSLGDRDIDQFLIVARAVGTFSRALDTSSSTKLPSLHMTAAAASRDVTLLHAMALLHQANYDIGQAVKFLVPPPSKQHYPLDADKSTSHKTVSLGGPILCRDQMEEWSAAEANLFEEAVEKYGKEFNDVRNDFLPWKSIRDIVEYYYMWKTTNRYVDVKKAKNQEHDKLKQVYIPNYNKPNANLVGPPNTSGQPIPTHRPCESCSTQLSMQWYAWGPASLQMRLCSDCWTHWKKFGGLKKRSEYEHYDLEGSNDLLSSTQQQAAKMSNVTLNPLAINKNNTQRPSIPGTIGGGGGIVGRVAGHVMNRISPNGAKTTRVAFCIRVDPLTKMARKLATKVGNPPFMSMRRASRSPFKPIDHSGIRNYCHQLDTADIIKCAMAIFKVQQPQLLPVPLIAAITQSSLFSSKRVASSNGSDLGAPSAKRPAPTLA